MFDRLLWYLLCSGYVILFDIFLCFAVKMSKKNLFELKVSHMLGFSGNVIDGLCVHQSLEYIIYPIATDVIVENINSKEQSILENETPGEITTLACSNSGDYVAAGYLSYPGFKAIINIWDFHSRHRISSYDTHKDRVHTLKFSYCNDFIISVGGYGEENSLICYSIKDKEIFCGSNAANNTSGDAFTLHIMNTKENIFVSGGENTIRFWKFHPNRKFLEFIDLMLSKYKRRINCMDSNEENTFLYCGTGSGDVLKIKVKEKAEDDILIENTILFGCFGKKTKRGGIDKFSNADRYILGITVIQILNDGRLLIGSGNGTMEIVEEGSVDKINTLDLNPNKLISPTLPIFVKGKKLTFNSRITSAVVKKNKIFLGTEGTEVFFIDLNDFNVKKFISSHTADINDIVFPSDFSAVFATASDDNIEIWGTEKCDKLLSINVKGTLCNAISFLRSGEAMISVWNDGHVRIHTPETGKCIFQTKNALKIEPTAISVATNDSKIIIGDSSGEIQFWKNEHHKLSSTKSIKKHKNRINAISINNKGDLALSAGNEGLCVLWDLNECSCKTVISCLTICHSVTFHPNENDIITCGKDKKIRIWSPIGCLLKEIEASKSSVNCLDLSSDGKLIATGGCDLKIWNYPNKCKLVAVGHSADIFKVKFSPDQCTILTVCNQRRISVWKLSSDILN